MDAGVNLEFAGSDGLGLVVMEGTKYVVNIQAPIAKEVMGYLNQEHDYGNKVTGKSVEEVIRLVNSYKATIVGIGLLLDRSGGAVKFPYPVHSLATVSANSWEAKDCPLCGKGEPVTQRGSRKM